MELKDKLNLLWKFLFLAIFTYGVICVTCCKKALRDVNINLRIKFHSAANQKLQLK